MKNGWVGVDLDGTLAVYTKWQGIEHIGEPIQLMIDKVHALLNEGYTVKILTARVGHGEQAIKYIKEWLIKQRLPELEVTNKKDYGMLTVYDDRCIQVETNTGKIIGREIV